MSRRWLMLLYQMPTRPSTQRVYVWRRLKTCGVVYLQNSVCVLPDGPRPRADLEKLKEDIEARRGEAKLLSIQLTDPADNRRLRELFLKQSEDDYEEFLDKCRDYHSELGNERAKNHFTFGELDENEAEIEKLRTWLPKIRSRDFFKARLGGKATEALVACERDIARFGREVAEKDRSSPDIPISLGKASVSAAPRARRSRVKRTR